MRNLWKKGLSMLVTLSMVLSLMPTMAFAAEEQYYQVVRPEYTSSGSNPNGPVILPVYSLDIDDSYTMGMPGAKEGHKVVLDVRVKENYTLTGPIKIVDDQENERVISLEDLGEIQIYRSMGEDRTPETLQQAFVLTEAIDQNYTVTSVGYTSRIICNTAEGGTVKADKGQEVSGGTATLTVTPESGCELEDLIVKDATGERIDVESDNTFTMPAYYVTVSATFVEISVSMYTVTISEGNTSGAVGLDGQWTQVGTFVEGNEVTLTLYLNQGDNELKSIKITYGDGQEITNDKDGNPINLQNNGDTFTFIMPASDVRVDASVGTKRYVAKVGTITGEGIVKLMNNHGDPISESEVCAAYASWVTVYPEAGNNYSVGTITVTDAEGNPVTVESGNRFRMPKCTVTVDATFTKNPSITVSVVDENGNPVIGTAGSIDRNEGANWFTWESTDTNYEFIHENLVLGTYTVSVISGPSGYSYPATAEVTLTETNKNPEVTVTLQKGTYTVENKTTDENVTEVTIVPASVIFDTVVTVIPAFATGYELDKISLYADENCGTEIIGISVGEDGTFTMPKQDVYVKVTAKKISYTVSVESDITGGTVEASPITAHYGDQITVTVSPDTGYGLVSGMLTYTPDGGSAVAITGNSFTMPAANVTISATFAALLQIDEDVSGEGFTEIPGVDTDEDGYFDDGEGARYLPVENDTDDTPDYYVPDGVLKDEDAEGKKDGLWTPNGNVEGPFYVPIYNDDDTDPDGFIFVTEETDNDGVYEDADGNEYIPDQDGDNTAEPDIDGDGIYEGTKDDITYIPDKDGDDKPEPDVNGDGIYEGTEGNSSYIPVVDGSDPAKAPSDEDKKKDDAVVDDNKDGIYDEMNGDGDEDGTNDTYYVPVDSNDDGYIDGVKEVTKDGDVYIDPDTGDEYIPDQNGDGLPEVDDDGDGIFEDADGNRYNEGGSDYRPSSPSSNRSSTKYNIVVEKTKNGVIKSSDRTAKKGETITLTVTPAAEFDLRSLKVVDRNGNQIDLKDNGDGTYSFKMPRSS